jgi:hypothetical protein
LKKIISFFFATCILFSANSQKSYWQQEVHYVIDVSLNDKEHSLDAYEKIEYINHSPDTLKFIWFHLWPNAYKNDRTAFCDQLLENGNTQFYFSGKEERGYINRLDFKVDNLTAQLEDHPQHIDIVKLLLPVPLPPGQKCLITTPFHVKLPYNFSRSGHEGESYQVTQWYPKPAVYDSKGWHPMPYLDQGEFYSEFGTFDVRITVPKNYVVAATGELQNEEEKAWLKSRASFSWEPAKEKIKTVSGSFKTILQPFPTSAIETKTLQYKLANIHDFAWFADKRFIVNYDSCKLPSGKVIDVFTYYTESQKKFWHNSIHYCKEAVRFYSSQVGEYPYSIIQAVQGPQSFGGGMEYPTITVLSPVASLQELDLTIAHELGHNWFYGILASNERDHPWMDEGMNSYYEHLYAAGKYKNVVSPDRKLFETIAINKMDQPIETVSEQFNEINYNLVAYYKTSEWMRYLESKWGTETFMKVMQAYYNQWQFKHPQPDDFKKIAEETTGQNQDSAFSLLHTKGLLPNQKNKKGTDFILGVTTVAFQKKPDLSKKNQIILMPAVGFNSYDKLMPGGLVTNYNLPPVPFQFLAAPMYGTGSKKFTGMGTAHYSFFPGLRIRKVDLFLNVATFSNDLYTDTAGKKTFLAYQKLVPGFRLTWNQPGPRSTLHRFLQWKTYFIGEDHPQFYRDTVISGIDTTIFDRFRKVKTHSVINQLRVVIENNRALYPWSGEWKLEQSDNFFRAAFTGTYFFNYAKGGGLNVRLFAGKFFYTTTKTSLKQFETSRYHLNLTGANGYEDYTYSDYFIGRNKFEGLASQQIMLRDGGFKVRTDLLANKIGKTDNWLIAANFNTTIPASVNPFNLLPVKIPLKLFFDIGTTADNWKQNEGQDRILFDAGLHLSLLKGTVNLYAPLFYSKVYRDYFKSTISGNRFWKTLSFTVDFSNFTFRKIDRNLSILDE